MYASTHTHKRVHLRPKENKHTTEPMQIHGCLYMCLTVFVHAYRLLCPIIISFSLLDYIREGGGGR